MHHDIPTIDSPSAYGEQSLNERGRDALQKLELTLAAQGIPKSERDEFKTRFITEITGEEKEGVIKTILGKFLLESMRRARELKVVSRKQSVDKSEGRVNFCMQCGAPVASAGANFCTMCGNKLEQDTAIQDH